MKKRLSYFMILCLCLFLAGCGQAADDETAETVDKSDVINSYLVSINPEARIDEDAATGKVIEVHLLSGDAENYYKELDVQDKDLKTVVCEMVDICLDNGLLNENNTDVNIVVLKYQGADEKVLENKLDIIRAEVESKNSGIVVNDSKVEDYNNPDSDRGQTWFACPNCEEGIAKCPVCGGNFEWKEYHEPAYCQNCDNGVVIETETREGYNGTPCRVCGDVGTLDDGMHGGKRAECGECVGFGASHQIGDSCEGWRVNGDYRSYAFSNMEFTNETTCMVCGGTGLMSDGYYSDSVCDNCNRGTIICTTCGGRGGWMMDN